MEHLSLYRKYRPHNFDNLVGQDHVRTTLINSFKNGQTAHAYLFTGPRGTGKTSTARIVAKAINCLNLRDGFDPCDTCDICKETAEGRLIDLIEIDAASNRGIDEVRDLKEKINFAPTRAKSKVYIIDEVHMMTKEAFNALLKTLEEPPAHVYFILATTEVHKIPETIVSRCQRFDFRRINEKALMTRLSFICQMEKIEAEDAALEAICRYVEGGLRDGINLLEQLSVGKKLEFSHVKQILGLSSLSFLEDFYAAISGGEMTKALSSIDDSYHQGIDLRQFTHEFLDLLRGKMLELVRNGREIEAYKLSEMITVFQETQMNMESTIPQLPLEVAVVRIMAGNSEKVVEKASAVVSSAAEKIGAMPKVEPTPVNFEREHKAVPKVEQEPAIAKPKVELGELSLEKIKENWPRVSERIKNPALRISLKDGKIAQLDEHGVVMEFSTNFHYEKVSEPVNKSEVEFAMNEVFSGYLKIVPKVKTSGVSLKIEEEPPHLAPDQKPQNSGNMEEALNIFGGGIVQ